MEDLNQPTQVNHPWLATARTAIQTAISAILVLVVIVPEVIEAVLESFGETMPESIRLWLIGAAGFVTALAAALTRIMAIPAVNKWLANIGLAARP